MPAQPGRAGRAGAVDAAWRDQMRALLYELASDPTQRAETRIHAADKLLNRIEGLPVARTITAETDLSTLTRDDIAERIRARLAELASEG